MSNIQIMGDSIDEIVDFYKVQLKKKNMWLFIQINFKGRTILLKQFENYVQRSVVDGIHYRYTGDYKTKKSMLEAFEKLLKDIAEEEVKL